MEFLLAFQSSPDTSAIIDVLSGWVRDQLIRPLIVVESDGPVDEETLKGRWISWESATPSVALAEILGEMQSPPAIIQVNTGRLSGEATNSREIAEAVLRNFNRYVDSSIKGITSAAFFATDSPAAKLHSASLHTWNTRFFLAPEDRVESHSQVAILEVENFPGHAAAGIASLFQLWNFPSEQQSIVTSGALQRLLSSGTLGQATDVQVFRQFVRVVEFPGLLSLLTTAANDQIGSDEYPNPDLVKFERTSLGDDLDYLASAFVSRFPELQIQDVQIIPPAPTEKLTLMEGARRLLQEVIDQFTTAPVLMLDAILGEQYDRLVDRIEQASPSGAIKITRWNEIGSTDFTSDVAVEQVASSFDRLLEPSVSEIWKTYVQMSLGLIDGADNQGISLVRDHLFATSASRRRIAGNPHEIADDPWKLPAESTQTSTSDDLVASDATVLEENQPIRSLAGTIRLLITDAIGKCEEHVETLRSLRSGDDAASATNQLGSTTAALEQISSASRKSSRVTLLGILASLALMLGGCFWRDYQLSSLASYAVAMLAMVAPLCVVVLLIRNRILAPAVVLPYLLLSILSYSLHLSWTAFTLTVTGLSLVLSPIVMVASVWTNYQRKQQLVSELKQVVEKSFLDVVREAHFGYSTKKLKRRLNEFDDWHLIVGQVLYRPYDLHVEEVPSALSAQKFLPLAIGRASASLTEQEESRLRAHFQRALFSEGWLNRRYQDVREKILSNVLTEIGHNDDGVLRDVEGDTNQDRQSIRRMFLERLRRDLESDADHAFVGRVQQFLRDLTPKDIAATVTDSHQHSFNISNFLDLTSEDPGSLLTSHWVEMTEGVEVLAGLQESLKFGSEVIYVGDTAPVTPPRIVFGCAQFTNRINAEDLQAFFTKETD